MLSRGYGSLVALHAIFLLACLLGVQSAYGQVPPVPPAYVVSTLTNSLGSPNWPAAPYGIAIANRNDTNCTNFLITASNSTLYTIGIQGSAGTVLKTQDPSYESLGAVNLTGIAVDSGTNIYAGDLNFIWQFNTNGFAWGITYSHHPDRNPVIIQANSGSLYNVWNPVCLAVDNQTNVYFSAVGGAVDLFSTGPLSDRTINNYVCKVTNVFQRPDLVDGGTHLDANPPSYTAIAGTGNPGFRDGRTLFSPRGVAKDGQGNVYVVDQYANVIIKVSASGLSSIFAGNGAAGLINGPVNNAAFNRPEGIAIDGIGNIYVADTGNNAIRKIATNGNVTTFAGNTNYLVLSSNYVVQNGVGTNANFMQPTSVAVDRVGNVYVADSGNNMIRKIATNGNVTTLAGRTNSGFINSFGTNAVFNQPTGVAIDGSGNVYVVDSLNNTIRRIDSSTTNVTTLAGSTNAGFIDGVGTNAEFMEPTGVAVDGTGNVYVADDGNNMIRKITTNGNVTTVAGDGNAGFTNATGTNSELNSPSGVAVDGTGNVYVADTGNNAIRKIDASGNVNTLIVSAMFNLSGGLATDASNNLYVADTGNNAIRKIDTNGNVTTIAGNTNAGFNDGLGGNATFRAPTGITLDRSGNLYVIDTGNNAIRFIDTNGNVMTVAGGSNGGAGYTDGLGWNAAFKNPQGIAVSAKTNLFVTDYGNSVIRVLTLTNAIRFPLTNKPTYSTNRVSFPLQATVSMGTCPVTFSNLSTNLISITGGTNVTILGAGTATIVARQLTNPPGWPALPVTNSLVIARASNAITFLLTNRLTYSENPLISFMLQATASSGLPVTFTNGSTNISIDTTGRLTVLGAGTATIIATQAGNSNYLTAMPVTNTLIIAKAIPGFQFGNTNPTYNGSGLGVAVTTVPSYLSNKVTVTYSNSTFGASTNPPTNTGIYTATASVMNDPNYAGSGTATIQIQPAQPAFSFTSASLHALYSGTNVPVNLTNVNGAPVVITYNGSTNPPMGAGTYTVVASVSNPNFVPYSITNTLVIAKAPATLALSNTNTTYNGSNRAVTVTTIPPYLSNEVSVTYSNRTYGNLGPTPPVGVGTYTAIATLSDPNYAGSVTGSLVIAKGTQTITFPNPTNWTYNQTIPFANIATSSSGLPVTFTQPSGLISINSGSSNVTTIGVGTATLIASATGNSNYFPALNVTNRPVISKASNPITFTNLIAHTVFDAPFSLSATAASGQPVSFSTTNTNVVMLDGTNGTNVTIQGIGTASIVATAAGNALYLPATLTSNLLITAVPSSFSFAASSETNVYNGSAWPVLLATNPNNVPVNYTYSNTATHLVSANPPTNAGTYIVVASVSDTTNYTPYSATNTLVIAKATAPLSFSSTSFYQTFTGSPIQPTLVNPAGAPVSYYNVETLGSLHNGLPINVTYYPSRPPYVYRYVVVANLTDTNNYNSTSNTFCELYIEPGQNTINFPHQPPRMLGSPSFPLDTNAATWGAVSYSSASTNIRITGGNMVTIRGVGTATIVASQVGTSGNYSPALPVTNTLLITPPIPSNLSTYLVSTYAGNGTSGSLDATGTNASFHQPYGTAIDAAGNLYVADSGNNLIRKISPYTTNVTTIAGDGNAGFTDGMGTNAEFNNPSSVAVDASGNLYVADTGNNAIRRIDTLTTNVTTLAGSGVSGFTNGMGTNASFGLPFGICVDGNTNIFVADTGNNLIRRIDARTTNVTTFAGSGATGFSNGVGTNASFNQPFGICVDDSTNIYVADAGNNVIRRIDPRNNVTTLAGSTNGIPGFADGMGTAATFHAPSGIAADWQGNLYVSDTGNNEIRKILTNGVVKTIAGNTNISQYFNLAGGFSNGLGTNASFSIPCSLTVDGSGNVYVADSLNYAIRILTPTNAITFSPLTNQVYGNSPIGLFATASMGTNPVTFSTTNSHIITLSGTNGTNLTILGAGTATIVASQASSSLYPQAVPVTNFLIIAQAPVSVNLSNTNTTYNGSAQGVAVTTVPPSLSSAISVTYNGTTNLPMEAGSYSVIATLTNPNYTGSAISTLTINPASGPFGFQSGSLNVVYNGSNQPVGLTNPNRAPVSVYYISTTNPLLSAFTNQFSYPTPYPLNGGGGLNNPFDALLTNPLLRSLTNPPSGVGSYYVVALNTNTNDYTPPYFQTNTLTIAPISTPAFTFVSTNPMVTYNGSNVTVGLTNVSGTPVTVTYNGSTSPPVGAGTYTVVATVTDTNNYTFRSVTNTLVINQASNGISFPLTNRPVYSTNAASIPLQATATSGLPVSYASQSPNISISFSNQVTILGAGTATIVASQAGDGNYLPAIPVTNALVVGPAVASVSLSNTNTTYNGSPQGVAVTVSPPFLSNVVSVTYSNASYGPTSNPPTNAGIYPIVAMVNDPNYAGGGTSTLTITRASTPAFTFGSTNLVVTYNGSNVTVDLTNNTNGTPVTVTYNGLTSPPVGAGTYTVVATVTDTNNYTFRSVTNTLVIAKAPNVITPTVFAVSPLSYTTNPIALGLLLGASASSGLPVTYSNLSPSLLTLGPTNLILLGAGTATIVASQSGDSNYLAALPVTNPIVITKASNVITFFQVPNWVYNTNGLSNTYGLDAYASSGLPVTFTTTNSGLISISGTNVTLIGVGSGSIVASQTGNGTYAAATPLTNPFTISPKAANYMVTTYAGQTNRGFKNALGTNAAFMSPGGVALDRSGNLYVADEGNNMIRKIDTNGNVTTLAGNTNSGSQDGRGTNAGFWGPSGVDVDVSGNVYVADQYNNMIRKIDPSGNVITLAGNNATTNAWGWSGGYADGIGANARFSGPSGVAVDGSGNVFVADQNNNMIRKIDPSGNVTTWAGNNTVTNQWGPIGGYTNGIGTNALFSGPIGVAVDGSGNVYVADKYNSAIRRIDTNDVVTTVIADSSVFYGPVGVAVDGSGNLFVADAEGNAIREISAAGIVTTLAGGSYGWVMQNGLGTNATFNWPTGIAVDAAGHIYVGDIFNNAIRLLTPQ